MAFKALILNNLKRGVEAFALIKTVLFKNLGNFTCWHVYGMLNRSNKKFDDARKAFLNALKQDETNINVLRDLAILQLQLNDMEGHCESRRKMVVANSKIFAHFSGYLTAAYMIKNWTLCNEIWESVTEIYGHNPLETEKIHELTEMYLLRARIMLESGEAKKGVKFVTKNAKFMADDVRRNEILTQLLLANNQSKKAVEHFEELLRLNSSNKDYYLGILKAMEVDLNNDEQILAVLGKYEEVLPKSNTH